METAYQVNVFPATTPSSSLAITGGSTVTLAWNPNHILPQVDPETFRVDVLLYTFNLDSGLWEEHSVLADNIPNLGSEMLTVPSGISASVNPIAMQVATSLHPSTRFDTDGLYRKVFRSQQRVGIWSSEYYYINPEMDSRRLCRDWNEEEGDNVFQSLMDGSIPCAPTLPQARLLTSGLSEIVLKSAHGNTLFSTQWMGTFHHGASQCFKQTTLDSM